MPLEKPEEYNKSGKVVNNVWWAHELKAVNYAQSILELPEIVTETAVI
jgi:hypothetical protein